MAGDILGGALIGGAVGGLAGGAFALYAKLTGKPLGRKQVPPRERPQTVPVPATWKTETKRALMGLVWLFVIWFLARVVIGAVIGGITGIQIGAHAVPGADNQEAIFMAGQNASIQFLHQYGLLVLLGSLMAAVAGTLTGFLPGTRRATRIVPPSGPLPEGQWPPPPSGLA